MIQATVTTATYGIDSLEITGAFIPSIVIEGLTFEIRAHICAEPSRSVSMVHERLRGSVRCIFVATFIIVVVVV